MTTAAVLGGSVVGSVMALHLARSGWEVALVDSEFDRIVPRLEPLRPRPGAPHTVQAHGYLARVGAELALRLPDVVDALVEAGAPRVLLREMTPSSLYDGGRPSDDDLVVLRARRATLDEVIGHVVAAEPGITRIAARATDIALEDGSVPRVEGLGLDTGDLVRADVVIDAGGRRSPVTTWLAARGIAQPEDVADCGVRYYGRHFRAQPGVRPPLNSGFADVHEFPSHAQLMFPGDNETTMVALCVATADRRFTRLRHGEAFQAVLEANEAFAPWLGLLEPITPVFALGSLNNHRRRLVDIDGTPLVLGLHQIGDALMTTNPIRGRGIPMGLAAAGALHDLLALDHYDPDTATRTFAAWQRTVLDWYYREADDADRALGRKLRANLSGTAAPPNAPRVALPDGHPFTSSQVEYAAAHDPDLFRIFLRALHVLDDRRVIASEPVTARVSQLLNALPPPPEPRTVTGGLHDRARLDALLPPFS